MVDDPRGRDASLQPLVPALVAGLPDLLEEVRGLLVDAAPEYAEFLAVGRDEVIPAATAAMQRLVTLAEAALSPPPQPPEAEPEIQRALFEEIGRIQWRKGTSLRTLLSAYQMGARAAWRHVSATALRGGVAPDALAALADAVFTVVDQLSSASAAGYVAEQSEAAITRGRLREELVELLLSGRSDSGSVRAAAVRAGWRLPNEAAVVFVEAHNEVGRTMLARLDDSCLPVRRPRVLGAIVPDISAPGRRQALTETLRGSRAVVGHPVPLDRLPASALIAEVAAGLQRSGVLAEDPVFVDQHLDAIIVHRDPRLLDALRRQCLAPLDALTPASRETLRATLRSWLRQMGDRHAVAAELHVHPQTVRYRLGRLQELFGPILEDPDGRLRLTLALAWDPAAPPAPTSGQRPASSRPGRRQAAARPRGGRRARGGRSPT